MIWTVMQIGWRRMLHGKLELLLTFVVPIVFFTIFALIFDRQVGQDAKLRVRAVVVDEDQSELSRDLTAALTREATIRTLQDRDRLAGFRGSTASLARELVRRGTITLAVVIPAGWSDGALIEASPKEIELLADTSNPIAHKVVAALVQRTASQQLAARRQLTQPGRVSNAAGAPQPPPPNRPAASVVRAGHEESTAAPVLVAVQTQDVLAENKANPVVSMYAAGIAVMFLLFSATGNSGSLLEEEENQTLERLMCSRLNMSELLAGKWCWLTTVGSIQVAVMFLWAQVAFGVNLTGHLPGFGLMTLVTAGAASSFALFLAAACRTRAQLNAVSIIVILTMSALGGSMVPRYIMSETMQDLGHYTFNAWALDGYTKVFWRDMPLAELWREVTVLGASALILLVTARFLARRWETL